MRRNAVKTFAKIFARSAGLLLVFAVVSVSAWAGIGGPYTADANTVALYHFDGNTSDASGNGHDGAIYGTNSWASAAQYGGGLDVGPGIGGFYANVGTVEAPGAGYTIEGWFKLSAFDPDAAYMIGAVGAGGTPAFFTRVNSAGRINVGLNGPFGWTEGFTNPGVVSVGQWVHIALTSHMTVEEGHVSQFYVNNVLAMTIPGASYNVSKLIIGRVPWDEGWNGNYYQGQVDEVRVSNVVRTDFSTVPEPGSLLALGSALVGLCGLYVRKSR